MLVFSLNLWTTLYSKFDYTINIKIIRIILLEAANYKTFCTIKNGHSYRAQSTIIQAHLVVE